MCGVHAGWWSAGAGQGPGLGSVETLPSRWPRSPGPVCERHAFPGEGRLLVSCDPSAACSLEQSGWAWGAVTKGRGCGLQTPRGWIPRAAQPLSLRSGVSRAPCLFCVRPGENQAPGPAQSKRWAGALSLLLSTTSHAGSCLLFPSWGPCPPACQRSGSGAGPFPWPGPP